MRKSIHEYASKGDIESFNDGATVVCGDNY